LRLVATTGSQTVTLPPKRALLVGRSVACDLPVRDPTVSRRHAELELAEGGLHLRDLGSTNGTFLNGERVSDGLARPGDQVAFGRSVFDVRDDAESAGGTPLESAAGASLDATVLRRVPIAWAADIAAQLADPDGTSLLRIRGSSPAERQERRLALLLDIAKELSGQPEVGHLLAKVVDLIFQVMALDRAAILLLGPDGETVSRASRCRKSGADTPWEVPRAIAERAIADRSAVLVEGHEEGDGRTVAVSREGIESAMCAPLLSSQGEALGLIYLDSLTAPRSFSDEDLGFLSSFAAIVAVAIENSRLVERARREALVLSNFQRYFAPELAEEIAAHPGEIGLGGAKRRAVVLFADIRGFTALSEELSPDEIALLLNEHFTGMVEVVFEHGGALDKFMGDAMMAIWGAPLARPDDADRAVRAAIGMQRALRARNRRRAEQGRRQLEVGIGVNLGEVFAGNIGSDRRLEYTVIGDAVNIAARLCSEAGPGEILIAEALCLALADPPPLAALDPVALKGKAQAVPVYRVEWRAGAAVPA
jgi:adenylate cyclase